MQGPHRVVAAAGRDTGIDLDRLVLTSAGARHPISDLPKVSVLEQGRTSLTVEVGPAEGPVWLVLGQSHNAGWELRDEGGVDMGAPRLLDGFGNGWLIQPSPNAPTSFDLSWVPQGLVRTALGLSLLAALGCLFLVACGRKDPGTTQVETPEFDRLIARRRRLLPRRAIGFGVLFTGFALINLPSWPMAAPVIGLALGLSLAGYSPARLTAWLGVVAMGGTTFLVAVDQIRFRHPRDFVWPQFFEHLHVVGVLAILCLAAAAVEALLEARSEFRRPVNDSAQGRIGTRPEPGCH